jgi:hypothetical protein
MELTIHKGSRVAARTRWTKRGVLVAMGLPCNARWPLASKRMNELMVESRRSGDDEGFRLLSMLKAFLKRNCYRECSCGEVIRPPGLKCNLCVPKS